MPKGDTDLHRDHPRPRGHEGLQRGRPARPSRADPSRSPWTGSPRSSRASGPPPRPARPGVRVRRGGAWALDESDAYQAAVPLRQAAADTDGPRSSPASEVTIRTP